MIFCNPVLNHVGRHIPWSSLVQIPAIASVIGQPIVRVHTDQVPFKCRSLFHKLFRAINSGDECALGRDIDKQYLSCGAVIQILTKPVNSQQIILCFWCQIEDLPMVIDTTSRVPAAQ